MWREERFSKLYVPILSAVDLIEEDSPYTGYTYIVIIIIEYEWIFPIVIGCVYAILIVVRCVYVITVVIGYVYVCNHCCYWIVICNHCFYWIWTYYCYSLEGYVYSVVIVIAVICILYSNFYRGVYVSCFLVLRNSLRSTDTKGNEYFLFCQVWCSELL